ncbi:MAG: lysylphosphatidylglycerol synthase domain-containing protein, partial [Candidatus Aureabacteria bacterium]|nr:lysylphosphatidylglycerol synthase domain-containing protein [Candidatus Auribacterota bacterium]
PIAIFFAFFACALLFLLLLYSRALIKKIPFLRRLVGRLPFEATILRLYESFYSYRSRPRAVAGALGISCAMQLVGNAIILAIARMLGIREVGYSHLLLLMPLIGTIFAIPVTPSGWGTGELAFCAFLGALGVPYTRAIALDFVMRAMVISWSLLGGALYAMPCWRVSSDEIAEEKALHVV